MSGGKLNHECTRINTKGTNAAVPAGKKAIRAGKRFSDQVFLQQQAENEHFRLKNAKGPFLTTKAQRTQRFDHLSFCRIRRIQVSGCLASVHSQIRMTCQPARCRVRLTSRSRVWLPASFFFQNARLFAGLVACLGQSCQKMLASHRKLVPQFQQPSVQCTRTHALQMTPIGQNPLNQIVLPIGFALQIEFTV